MYHGDLPQWVDNSTRYEILAVIFLNIGTIIIFIGMALLALAMGKIAKELGAFKETPMKFALFFLVIGILEKIIVLVIEGYVVTSHEIEYEVYYQTLFNMFIVSNTLLFLFISIAMILFASTLSSVRLKYGFINYFQITPILLILATTTLFIIGIVIMASYPYDITNDMLKAFDLTQIIMTSIGIVTWAESYNYIKSINTGVWAKGE